LPRQERMTAKDAEKRLLNSGFILLRTKGSHRIYKRKDERIVIPFHGKEILHPKIAAQVISLTQRN